MNTSPRLVEDLAKSFNRSGAATSRHRLPVGTQALRAADLAGKVAVTNLTFNLEPDASPPVLWLVWPREGMKICAETLTLKGSLDDVSASVVLSLPDLSGVTNHYAGVVGRDGQFWVEAVPLVEGTNDLVLTATDVWGNVMTTNVAVVKTSFPLTLDPVPVGQLHQRFVAVTGTIGDPNYSVWVNGRQAVVAGNTWSAPQVPVTPGGVAWFEVTAYPPGENPQPDPEEPTRNPVTPNSIATENNTDKPCRSEVVKDFQGWYSREEGVYVFPSGPEEWTADLHYTHDWHTGQPAYGREGDYRWNSVRGGSGCSKHFTWPPSEWPMLNPGSWEGDCYPGSEEWGAPTIAGEHCAVEVKEATMWTDGIGLRDYVRHAQTQLRVYTGGKPVPKRRSLFVFSASASTIFFKQATPPYNTPWLRDWQRPIPPQDIVLGDLGPVGSDHRLYKALPDGETHDVTPQVKNKEFYWFGTEMTPQKHKIFIAANGYLLDPERVRPEAKYCVGMKINLAPVIVPAVDGIQEKQVSWTLAKRFINAFRVWKPNQEGPPWDESCYDSAWGLTDFRVDPEWLHREQTRAWWLTGGLEYETKPITVGLHIKFENAQEVGFNLKGLLDMHQPSVEWVPEMYEPGVPHGRKYATLLQVKVGDFNSEDDRLQLGADSKSLFRGSFGCTQLIIRDSAPESWSDWRLDNTFPYISSTYNFGLNEKYGVATFVFGDGPDIPWGGYVADLFEQYFQFRPDTPGSIWVTLGKANWDWRARIVDSTTNPEGWDWASPPSFYHSQSIAPSAELPEWRERKLNLP